ncbi:bifunctional uridylyltransferase/uridylyl-removing protein GlnD [Oceanimonas baumannii]|uniref:Bifunctional uridylyltransferase/uridylyl-removing enzyme n=1 Tax=Oceanimonas baumannii TaxID=129578 RepID=A0A235CNJ2_9GAMM|nr:bifunctional uridylyltransferase/uridylyl-removing protein GlnD [Oceanimonas baumannii]OYD26141.1 [protein-PII] uridylyltransferase [Oceanimonas baumannii]TDW62211.1 UTP--GlnB (protein PII) uridylyltransferase GlnD [Oceanimonas baumannii]
MDANLLAPALLSPDELTISRCKEILSRLQSWLEQRFEAGDDINELVCLRSQHMDQLLTGLWARHGLAQQNELALVAVGGYGRGELHPCSDIDLLVLSRHRHHEAFNERIGHFVTQLWDLHLEVGHSVRTVAECVTQGEHDITVATNLIEARLITGCYDTFADLSQATAPDRFWPSQAFFEAKRSEQEQRHRQFHDSSYKLEPDIKNSPGGLRDIQTISWVARRHFGATTLGEMASHGFLSDAEFDELQDCQNFLWKLRFALHTVTGRADNRLLFDRQRAVAMALGYAGEGNQPIEYMMKRYYQTVRRVAELNELLLQLFDEAILGHIAMDVKTLTPEFRLRGRLIDLADPELFMHEPAAILRLFYQIAACPQITGIYSSTLRELREARRTQHIFLCERADCRRLFMMLLRHPGSGRLALPLMHRYGVLAAYFPQWSKIVGQMQFDMFHAYPVDEHTYRVLKNINGFREPGSQRRHPLCHNISNRLRKPELLLLAGLFHDIAKGRGGDHSTLGADDALAFCMAHGLDRSDARLVSWLVRQHLLMSVTAQRRDIHDPDVIREFATQVRDELHLDFLYCLTVADICATNDTLWNDWKGSLLRDLYFSTQKALRRGLENPPDLRLRIRENQQQARRLLDHLDTSYEQVKSLWTRFPADYFLRHTPEQIAWHSRHILAHAKEEHPLVQISQQPGRGGSELFIYSPDSPNLFGRVAAALDQKNLNIHDAQIMTSKDGYALDTFIVLEPDGQPVSGDRLTDLCRDLADALASSLAPVIRARPPSRRHREFYVPTQVHFLQPARPSKRTLMELVALDTPGLLARIGAVFSRLSLNLHAAKITTIGERVEDFFSLTNAQNCPLTEQEQQQLREKLVDELKQRDKM